MRTYQFLFFLLLLCFPNKQFGQDIELYSQFNGRFDYVALGNTLNLTENGSLAVCDILTSSSATLTLNSNQNIIAAYLYWAGSGTGDLDILLNNTPVSAERVFTDALDNNRVFFAAFSDITSLVQSQANTTYTVSEFDFINLTEPYCSTGTNFGGWAISVIYEDDTLPLNQLNVYDGLQSVPTNLTITLDNLNVLDNENAKIGFIAWEGDSNLAINETLMINGNTLSNPPLNPANNAFNGTNSITGSSSLYNMDLDIYNIQNNISVGDTSANISLTSSQDYVMINAIVTKLNSQLPDATIVLNDYSTECNTGVIEVDYTVYNVNSTEFLPANTPITFYAEGQNIGTYYTQNDIAIGGSETGSVTLTIPINIETNFTFIAVVDDAGNGNGTVVELLETNNSFSIIIEFKELPKFNTLQDLITCNLGLTRGLFNFSAYEELVKQDVLQTVSFYQSYDNATLSTNQIFNTSNFEAQTTPKEIFVRIENEFCYSITSFNLRTRNCPPTIYNGVSANNDGLNDGFFIDGLRNIFVNFELEIYNRWGRHIWTGNNSIPDWDGKVDKSIGNEDAPEGTYFYILHLNDPDYTKPLTGYLYLTR